MLTFDRHQKWSTYRMECDDLWREHYEDLCRDEGRMKMRPDEAAYRALDEAGSLDILIAREAGIMVGYALSVVRPHLHYADTLIGIEDAYFLTARLRKGMAGVRLIREWEASMRARGCSLIFCMVKDGVGMRYRDRRPDSGPLDNRPIFERLGFGLDGYMMAKWLDV